MAASLHSLLPSIRLMLLGISMEKEVNELMSKKKIKKNTPERWNRTTATLIAYGFEARTNHQTSSSWQLEKSKNQEYTRKYKITYFFYCLI